MNKQLATVIHLACLGGAALASPAMAQQTAASEQPAQTQPAGTTDPQRLKRISVTDTGLDATTEDSGSYGSNSATIFKGAASLRDIPQPVTVLTREFLEARALLDLNDVLQNTPGVTVDYTDSERVTYFSRGHQIDALQVDGLTFVQNGSIFVQPDTAVLDRVEILRGASGLLRGSGNPSATVNMVRKRPTTELQASAGAQFGSWDRQRFEGDLSSPLNDSGSLRGRMVAVFDKKDFFQKAREEERKVFYGVIAADLGADTTLTASFQHTDLEATGAWGNLPAGLDGSSLQLPRDTYLGAAWNRWDRYNQQAFAELEHRFGNDWSVHLKGAYTRMRMKNDGFKQSYFTRASTTNPYLFNVTTSFYDGDENEQTSVGLITQGSFPLFGRQHQLVAGVETQSLDVIATRGYGSASPLNNVDIRTWDPYTSYPEPFLSPGNGTPYIGIDDKTEQWGTYATARLSLADPLQLIVGARLSWWDYEVPTRPASNYSVDRELTPYAGVIYDITGTISAYASYTEIFTPQREYDASGNIIDPIRGEDYEAGFKGEFFDGRLNATIALFRIDNVGKAMQDSATPDPCLPYYTSGFCRMAGGKTRSEGWELELAGEILPGWSVMGGYTNTSTEYLRDSSMTNVGRPLRSIDPKHLLRLFTSYRLAGVFAGLTLGAGVQAQSDAYVTAGALTSRQGGYTIINAMASYAFNETWSAQLNGNNLADKVYFKKYSPTGISNYYGDPRNVLLSLQARF